MFLETTNRKGEKVVFATASDLFDSIFEMDTVTLGKTLAVLPEDGNEKIWFAAFDAHADKARVAGKLKTVVTNIMNRSIEAQDAETAKAAARRLDPYTDPEKWWEARAVTKEIDLEALNDEDEEEEARAANDALEAEQASEEEDAEDDLAEKIQKRVEEPDAERVETRAADALDAIADVDAKREALRATAPKAPKRVKKDPKDVKPRVRAQDDGPTESLGRVEIELRKTEGRKDGLKGETVTVEDFYGDGSYNRTCVPCGVKYTYDEGFGFRILKGAKVVQPQCRKCRRKASKAWADRKRAEAQAKAEEIAALVEASGGDR